MERKALPRIARPAEPSKKITAAMVRQASVLVENRKREWFSAPAAELAASLGWSGDANLILDGIRVADAQLFLGRILHQIHLFALNPKRVTMPDFEKIVAHLHLDTDGYEEARNHLLAELEKAVNQELEAAKS